MPKLPNELEKALPGIHQFEAYIKEGKCTPADLGYRDSWRAFKEFARRYRFSWNYQGLRLSGYADQTVLGYEAVTKTFFVWTAFERYQSIAGLRYKELFRNVDRQVFVDLKKVVEDNDPDQKLKNSLLEHSHEKAQDNLYRFYAGNPYYVIQLAGALRNMFAHGYLTAHPGSLRPEKLDIICTALSQFLLAFMRADFNRRLQPVVRRLESRAMGLRSPAARRC
ncbi:MAG: hypothetical protein ACE5G0_18650 [Rhodothermales bacterium]